MRTPAWPGSRGTVRSRGGGPPLPDGSILARSPRSHRFRLGVGSGLELCQSSRVPVLPLHRRPSLSGDRLRHPPLNGGWGWNPAPIFSCASGRGGPELSLHVSVRGAACAVAHPPTSCSRPRARHRCDASPHIPTARPLSASVRRFARVAATLFDTLASPRLPNSLPNAFTPCSPLLPPLLVPSHSLYIPCGPTLPPTIPLVTDLPHSSLPPPPAAPWTARRGRHAPPF